jgi:hypothetical protein
MSYAAETAQPGRFCGGWFAPRSCTRYVREIVAGALSSRLVGTCSIAITRPSAARTKNHANSPSVGSPNASAAQSGTIEVRPLWGN